MADVHSPDIRSKNMRAIRSKNTKPEIKLRKLLFKAGYRYRIAPKNLPAKPDIYLPKYKAVILVNGCFWHGHDCHLFKLPATRTEYWKDKISGNIKRDSIKIKELNDLGIRVLVCWECCLKGKHKLSDEKLTILASEWIKSDYILSECDTKGLRQVNKITSKSVGR